MPEQDNRPAVYLEGSTAIYRASAIGHCIRMMWASRTGLEARPIPEKIKKAMDEGTELEEQILAMLYEDHNFTFSPDYKGQQFQIELEVGHFNGVRVIVRGKTDEIGYPLDKQMATQGALTIDVKAFKQALVDEYKAKGILGIPRYAWQQSVYAIGFGKTHFYMPIYNKDTGKIEEWSLEPVAAPFTFEQIRERVMTVEEAVGNAEMPSTCLNEFGCQYYYLHDDQKKPVDHIPEDAQVMLTARINLSNKIKVLTGAKEKLDDAIKAKLAPDVTYHFDGHTITVIPNPARFNTTNAKKILTDAELDWQNDPYFWTPGVGFQLRVNAPKKGGNDAG